MEVINKERIQRVVFHISKNFRQELRLEDLSEVACLSKFHFQKLFKKETGFSPLHYLNKLRLEHAAHYLIVFPNCKQTDVAFECGFSSPSVFSRSFSKYYNMSPSAYQKTNLKNTNSKKVTESTSIPVTYLSKKLVLITPTNLEIDRLNELYRNIIYTSDKSLSCYGIFLDAPIHKPLKECRYYAGILTDKDQKTKIGRIIEIEEGYYTYFEIQGSFSALSEQLIYFKENQIDSSPYYISSLIGFEKIKLPENAADFDYFTAQRTIYIQIKRK